MAPNVEVVHFSATTGNVLPHCVIQGLPCTTTRNTDPRMQIRTLGLCIHRKWPPDTTEDTGGRAIARYAHYSVGFGHSFAIEVLRYSRLRTTPRTILVVDDHRVFLQLVTTILEGAHFTVLPAATPKEALRIEAGYKGRIDLLLSDVMMPTMNGPELAHKLKVRRPGIRILLMSLFDNGSVLLLNHGWHFIQKPFLADALLTRVNELLKSRPRRQAPVHFDTRKVGPRRAEA